MYKAVTRGIQVTVVPRFLEEESAPDQGRFFFAYTVEITNRSEQRVQLRDRHWVIMDADGRVQEVRGEGVVGEQPTLDPGDSFSYTSGCPLGTPTGSMQGSYTMVGHEGDEFEAEIPAFSLDTPGARRVVH